MLALASVPTAVGDIPHLLRVSAPEHLGYEAIIIASIVARIDAFKAVPVIGKDLFEEAPGRRSGGSHQAASLRSIGLWIVALFYHV